MKRFIVTVSFLAASYAILAMAGFDGVAGTSSPQAPPAAAATAPPVPLTYNPPPNAYDQPSNPTQTPPAMIYGSPSPRFIYSPPLGMYVSVGIPYDMYYSGSSYYYYSDGFWYVGPTYGGPWMFVEQTMLPRVFTQYRYDQIRAYREAEHREYLRDPSRYTGKMHEPVWQSNEPRREEYKEPRKEMMKEPNREEMRPPHKGGTRKEEKY
jgi:hypothetical protein